MTGNQRATLCLRTGVLAVAAYIAFAGKPSANGQTTVVQTEGVVRHIDEEQDISLSKLAEFQRNQENWNKQTGSDLALTVTRENRLEQDVAETNGNIKGAATLITLLASASLIFQVRSSMKKSGGE